jgi:hypothetical protein
MKKEEQTEILTALRRSQEIFLDAVEGIAEDFAAKRPGEERWSALECVEHVALSEEFLLSSIQQAEHGAARIDKGREAAILALGTDRTRPAVSPEAVSPRGRFASLSEAVRHFQASRAQTISYVENCSADLRSMLTTHPLLGTVNCYEVLLLIVVHPERHAKQIAGIRGAIEP